ncbi:hypothetical protein LINPERPRIM_LOCUS19145, partial [Linum perenne]
MDAEGDLLWNGSVMPKFKNWTVAVPLPWRLQRLEDGAMMLEDNLGSCYGGLLSRSFGEREMQTIF